MARAPGGADAECCPVPYARIDGHDCPPLPRWRAPCGGRSPCPHRHLPGQSGARAADGAREGPGPAPRPAAPPARCTLAYWHQPLYDSKDSPSTTVRPLRDALYGAGVEVVVNAHYGFYERFAPQTPAAAADPAYGIREFIAGTGGATTTSCGTTP